MEATERAIRHAVRAAACREAARLDERSAGVWTQVAEAERRKCRLALGEVAHRAVAAGRCA